jgi:hypothetical protein
MAGDNRYHSIFGSVNKCIAVHPSDIAPALIALNAKVVTDRRTIDAENFFDVRKPGNTVLRVMKSSGRSRYPLRQVLKARS